jgi:very-short-patch-repair endonuclease
MGLRTFQRSSETVWDLARRQHGVVTRDQLVALGYGKEAILHRVRTGRLHPSWPGVYVVGRPEATREGRWMAAVLTCGPGAALSHTSAAGLWKIHPSPSRGWPEVSIPAERRIRPRARLRIHRRVDLAGSVTHRDRIPVTSISLTLVDLAPRLTERQLERAVNQADILGLIDPGSLRAKIEGTARRPGLVKLRRLLDTRSFRRTDSDLERRFLRLIRAAGLPIPLTQRSVCGHRVDFYWPELRLVVETDGLTYHRTPAQQARDRHRDQAIAAAGLIPLRFTHHDVVREPERVIETVSSVIRTRR